MRGLDTYVGRRVTRTETDTEGNWFIELDGGVRIINTDKRRTLPQLPGNGVSLLFTTQILEENQTQMVLRDPTGQEWRIAFNPLKYQIFDGSVRSDAWAPQVEDVTIPIPDDPSPDRVADGPEQLEEE